MSEHLNETGVIRVNGAWATSLKFEATAQGSHTGTLAVRFMQGRAQIASVSLSADEAAQLLGERNIAAIQKQIANTKEDGAVKGELRGTQLHYREVSVTSATTVAPEENGISVDRYRHGAYPPQVSDSHTPPLRSPAASPTEAPNRENAASQPASNPRFASTPDDPPHQATGRIPVPTHIAAKYLVKNDQYHFDDQTLAFVDRGTRLTAKTLNRAVIQDLVAIAKARDWQEVTVRGTADFRREAWKEAHAAGLDVTGYVPTTLELQAANKVRLRRDVSHEGDRDAPASPTGETPRAPKKNPQQDRWTGTLVAFGSAPYQNDPEKSLSYFVTLKDEAGKEHTHWGVGLADAISTSRSGVGLGDAVSVQRVGATTVFVPTRTVDENGEITTQQLTTKRHQWVVEKMAFFKAGTSDRADVQTPPEAFADPQRSTTPTHGEPPNEIGRGMTRAQEVVAAVRSAAMTREELQLRYPEISQAVFDHLSSHDQLAQAYVKAGLIRESDREQVIATMRDRLGRQLERGDAIQPLDDKTVRRTIANSIRRVAADIGRAPVEINPGRAAEHVLTPKAIAREDPQVRA
jgi:hypothetical protein